ncbi:MAG: hypothetical protein PHO89_01185 [Methylacidiphilaceae bacterium]|nr:hypothetical protein [Candidatus Methylacidiphilaceae bacterium]
MVTSEEAHAITAGTAYEVWASSESDQCRLRAKDTAEGVILYTTDGSARLHNVNGPAEVHFVSGEVRDVRYCRNGLTHREDGPALMRFRTGGEAERAEWLREGKYDVSAGPSRMTWDAAGAVVGDFLCGYDRHGFLDRPIEAGPASVSWSADGSVGSIELYDHRPGKQRAETYTFDGSGGLTGHSGRHAPGKERVEELLAQAEQVRQLMSLRELEVGQTRGVAYSL